MNEFTSSVRTELIHLGSRVRITVAQLSAVNTPQFSWNLSRLSRHPQPVPPICQPEAAARAVMYAADHPRRKQYCVGAPTVGAVLADKVAAGLLDRYLARTGYDSQQTGEPVQAHRPDNLWRPLDGDTARDYGAHGVFDNRAHGHSAQAWLSRHAGPAWFAAALIAFGAAVRARRNRRS